MRTPRELVLPLLGLVAACGESIGPRPLHYELGRCGAVDIVPEDPGNHRPQSAALEWSTNPPTSGDHFEIWAAYDRRYAALERGFWVHNLEHGAVVLGYRCDAGCPAEVTMLEDAVRAMPVDASCAPPLRHRALVVEDPLLRADGTFVAVAWGAMYTATCVDLDAIAEFTNDFYASAPEDLCVNGASLGGTPILPAEPSE